MPIKTIGAQTLKGWLDKGEAVVIDVREPAEYEASHIPGTRLIPLANVSEQALPDILDKKLVIHCHAGRRGNTACEKLLAESPNLEIYNLEGGIEAWTQAGYEVKSSGTFFLPLDRQVQLAIGLCVLFGSILGYYTSPIFFFLTGFFGLGLTFAGLTGFCGLAMLMARMPWNQSHKATASCCSSDSSAHKKRAF